MSRFYGSLGGKAKTTATREGTTKSGISCHVRGWDVGVKISGGPNEKDQDCFWLWATSGSNGAGQSTFLGIVTLKDGKPIFDTLDH